MKPKPQLNKNLSRIEVMRPPKRKAVVQQNAAIGHIDTLHVDRESFSKILSDRKVKRRVRLQVVSGIRSRWIAIGKAGRVRDVRRSVRLPGQRVLRSYVQSVPLVVIQ